MWPLRTLLRPGGPSANVPKTAFQKTFFVPEDCALRACL